MIDEPIKPKKAKKKLAVPPEFLESAKSYDDKLVLVKYLAEKEKGRFMLLVKKMLEPEPSKKPPRS